MLPGVNAPYTFGWLFCKSHLTLDSISTWKSQGKTEILPDNLCDKYLPVFIVSMGPFSVREVRILGKYLKNLNKNHKQSSTFVVSVVIFEKSLNRIMDHL